MIMCRLPGFGLLRSMMAVPRHRAARAARRAGLTVCGGGGRKFGEPDSLPELDGGGGGDDDDGFLDDSESQAGPATDRDAAAG